jgi:hypothetical protein
MNKHEFRSPADLVEASKQATHAAAPISPAGLAGKWCNCDKATRGLVEVDIAPAGAEITVHAFGACTPTPCDWGAVPGLTYAENVSSHTAVAFSAHYKFSFVDTIMVGHLDQGSLIVETFEHFTDGSGRSDYYSRFYMCRCK